MQTPQMQPPYMDPSMQGGLGYSHSMPNLQTPGNPMNPYFNMTPQPQQQQMPFGQGAGAQLYLPGNPNPVHVPMQQLGPNGPQVYHINQMEKKQESPQPSPKKEVKAESPTVQETIEYVQASPVYRTYKEPGPTYIQSTPVVQTVKEVVQQPPV